MKMEITLSYVRAAMVAIGEANRIVNIGSLITFLIQIVMAISSYTSYMPILTHLNYLNMMFFLCLMIVPCCMWFLAI